eukprot:TRINITY_DN20392_c0_g1_i1.p1 TRINITY_DN20392_c0_g1~~TRINITY_DN20392_c0_g1_i1.p1  ORF type:complete len:365 (+),score=39.40 TRINITY_DN20392_c0_g1_i1:72-1166(+)
MAEHLATQVVPEPLRGPWFRCAREGCDRVVTATVKGHGPKNEEYYSKTHCCLACERGEGHGAQRWECPSVPAWSFMQVDMPDVPEPAHALVHVPLRSEKTPPLPAVLFVHGAFTYVYPETLWDDMRSLVDMNRVVRDRFVVIAPFGTRGEPLAVVSEWRTKADRYGNVKPYVEEFHKDHLWASFVCACKKLGPDVVDMARLHAIGYSMGAQAVWDLALAYGSRLAGVIPFAGKCSWKRFGWDRGEQISRELKELAIRSFHGEEDKETSTWKDFVWIGKLRGAESFCTRTLESSSENLKLVAHQWGPALELCYLQETSHCCWAQVWRNEDAFGLFEWMESLKAQLPSDNTGDLLRIFPASEQRAD